MNSFAYPFNLFWLLLVPFFVCLYVWARWLRRRNLRKFGNPEVLRHLMPMVSPYKPPLKITVQMAALALIIIAFARPWGALRDEQSNQKGIEVMIAVDTSNSMLASASSSESDGSQRMRTAKTFLERLVNDLDNDRVGLIMYAGEARTLIPLTGDYVSAKMFLNSIEPSNMEIQGTDIASAVELAMRSFPDDKNIGKAIVLLTDAEDLEDPERVLKAVQTAAKNGIQVDVVGVGTSTPVTIPYNGALLIDPETGQPVKTALNEEIAEKVAAAGKGIYVNAANSNALSELVDQLYTLEKRSLQSSVYARHDELYAIFAAIALALLIADVLLLDRKIGWLSKITFFKKEEME